MKRSCLMKFAQTFCTQQSVLIFLLRLIENRSQTGVQRVSRIV